MKRVILIFLALFFLGSSFGLAAPLASSDADLPALKACAANLEVVYHKHQARIPALAWEIDRRLKRMAEGVKDNQANYQLLVSHFAAGVPDMESRHLISNAIEGCQTFQAKLDDYSTKYFRFALSLFMTCLALVIAPFVYGTAATPGSRPEMKTGIPLSEKKPERSKKGIER